MIKKKWIIGLGMAAIMMGMNTAAWASGQKFYCVAYAWDADRYTVATIFKIKKRSAYPPDCSNCSVKWQEYVDREYGDLYTFTDGVDGYYDMDEYSKAKEVFDSYKSDARNEWKHPFYHATSFQCSGL